MQSTEVGGATRRRCLTDDGGSWSATELDNGGGRGYRDFHAERIVRDDEQWRAFTNWELKYGLWSQFN